MTSDAAPLRLLLYAVNGHGFGHIARLSVVVGALSSRLRLETATCTNSSHAGEFLPGTLFHTPENRELSFAAQRRLFANRFAEAVDAFRPDVVLADTHWLPECIAHARARGARAALVLRGLSPSAMAPLLAKSAAAFDHVLLPHDQDELAFRYDAHADSLAALALPNVHPVGPLARTNPGLQTVPPRVIFTLGGGGEYPQVGSSNTVAGFVELYAGARRLLADRHPGAALILAPGPYVPAELVERWPGEVLRTFRLHEHLGPGVTVVTRPGYNTCWETVAARRALVLVGDYRGFEDTQTTKDYLAGRGAALCPDSSPESLADAVSRAVTGDFVPRALPVNQGLGRAVELLAGLRSAG